MSAHASERSAGRRQRADKGNGRTRSTLVGGCCTSTVITAERSTPVARCAQLMHDAHVGSLVVVEAFDGRQVPVGMITDRDIAIEVVAFGVDAHAITAGDIMGPDLAVVREDEDLLAAMATMREHGVRRLPVLGRDGELRGVVSADDLWQVLAEEIDGLARVIRASRAREGRTRTAEALPQASV